MTVRQAAVGAAALVLGGQSGAPVGLTIVGNDKVESEAGVSDDSVIERTGVLSLVSAPDARSYNAQFNVDATLTNLGVIETSGDAAILDGSVSNLASGKVEFDGHTSNNRGNLANDGTWAVGPAGVVDLRVSSFDQQRGVLHNEGSLEFRGAVFRMEGGQETGKPVVLDYVTLADRAGPASFTLTGLNTISGTIPAGQTVTCLTTTASEPGDTDLATPAVTVYGKLAVIDSVAGVNDTLTGRLVNKGTFSIASAGSGARLNSEANIVNAEAGTFEASGRGFVLNAPFTNYGVLSLGKGTQVQLTGFTLTEGSAAHLEVMVGHGATSSITSESPSKVDLAGTLAVRTVGAPARGSTFHLVSLDISSVLAGKFTSITSTGPQYAATYTPRSLVLTAR